MPKRFVLDASLLEKYRVNRQTSPDEEILPEEVLSRFANEGECKEYAEELQYFIDLLSAVKDEKATIWYDQKAAKKYRKYMDQVPTLIRDLLFHIFFTGNCSIEMKTVGFTPADCKGIKDTDLKKKEIYLNLAEGLLKTNRVIVSTQEDKNNVYRKTSNLDILFDHKINCRCTEEHYKSLK